MLRRAILVLATATAVGSAMHSPSAFAFQTGDAAAGTRVVVAHRTTTEAARKKIAAVGEMRAERGGSHGFGLPDVWGHWGAYYGPMVDAP